VTEARRFPVVLLWHMHQPQYRDPISGTYILPWTYLHAIKDYVDMAAHLEANPRARAVVNFTPVLIEQLEELAARLTAHLERGEPLPDPVLALLTETPLPADPEARLALIQACLRAEPTQLIGRYPPYAELAALAALAAAQGAHDTVRQRRISICGTSRSGFTSPGQRDRQTQHTRVAVLTEAAAIYRKRLAVPELIGALSSGCSGLRAPAERGQVELATSPYGHPIPPLLIDFQSARESVPDAPLPHAAAYPRQGRAAWHLQRRRVFQRAFGRALAGCWPSEGAIAPRTAADRAAPAGRPAAAMSCEIVSMRPARASSPPS
jgi:hypothetical protein